MIESVEGAYVKEVIVALAQYNAGADRKLAEILSAVDPAILLEDQGSYYRSILGTLEHVAGGTLNTLRRFSGYFPYPSLAGNPLMEGDLAALKAGIHDKPDAVLDLLARVDAAFLSFARELQEDQLGRRFVYKNYKGEELEREYWAMIVHILNHATHHRGEISALLDRRGVANDFSGFTTYIK